MRADTCEGELRISDLLDELRRTLPDCSLCAYIDLDVQLVLSTSSVDRQRQEYLDDLARLAAALFATADSVLPKDSDGTEPPLVSLLTARHAFYFLRAPADLSEVVCCRCGPDVRSSPVAESAKLALSRLGEVA